MKREGLSQIHSRDFKGACSPKRPNSLQLKVLTAAQHDTNALPQASPVLEIDYVWKD